MTSRSHTRHETNASLKELMNLPKLTPCADTRIACNSQGKEVFGLQAMPVLRYPAHAAAKAQLRFRALAGHMTGWLPGLTRVATAIIISFCVISCSRHEDASNQPAKPPEPRNQTYRMIGGHSVISLVSSDELEIREGGQNIVCKYTKQDGRFRVVINALGTTTARYFNLTPDGLVDEDGRIFYEPAAYEKAMAQIELNQQLWTAVERDDKDAIGDLIDKGAAVETSDSYRSALLMAIETGRTNALAALLEHKADPNQKKGGSGQSALMLAISGGSLASVDLLLRHGARVNDRDRSGATPLIAAASLGRFGSQRTLEHDKIVERLCAAQASLDDQDDDGFTALARSLQAGNLNAAKILVAAGADRDVGKDKRVDAFTLAGDRHDYLEAIRTDSERRERTALGMKYAQQLLGVWLEEENSAYYTFNLDGTSVERNKYGAEKTVTWSVAADTLVWGENSWKITRLDDGSFRMVRPGWYWSAKRVKRGDLDAAREAVESVRRKFVGKWSDDQGDVFTINEDGTMRGAGRDGDWSTDGKIFISPSGRDWTIVSVDDSSFHLKWVVLDWHAQRVK